MVLPVEMLAHHVTAEKTALSLVFEGKGTARFETVHRIQPDQQNRRLIGVKQHVEGSHVSHISEG